MSEVPPVPPTCGIADMGKMQREDWRAIADILSVGGAVHVPTALAELPLAPVAVLARVEDRIVGLGAVKRARPGYAQQKMNDAGHSFDPNINELGYVALAKKWRGHGHSAPILDKLLEHFSEPLFATTDSKPMMHMLESRKFQKFGRAWKSGRGLDLTLWIRLN